MLAMPPFSSLMASSMPCIIDGQRAAAHGLERRHAAVHLGLRHERRRVELPGHHVVGQDLGQHRLVLGLEERLDGAGRQRRERGVGRGEHRERAGALQRSTRPAAFTAATSVV